MADQKIFFGKLMRQGYRLCRDTARRKAYDYAYRFKNDWQARFGNDDLVAGPSGVPGSAEPLKPSTIESRVKRGWYGQGMLYDPSLPHVDEEGQGTIKDSITMSEVRTRERGFYTEVSYTVTTDHPKFPLNEHGIGVPQRMTLFPTEQTIGTKFAEDLHKEYENILLRKPR